MTKRRESLETGLVSFDFSISPPIELTAVFEVKNSIQAAPRRDFLPLSIRLSGSMPKFKLGEKKLEKKSESIQLFNNVGPAGLLPGVSEVRRGRPPPVSLRGLRNAHQQDVARIPQINGEDIVAHDASRAADKSRAAVGPDGGYPDYLLGVAGRVLRLRRLRLRRQPYFVFCTESE